MLRAGNAIDALDKALPGWKQIVILKLQRAAVMKLRRHKGKINGTKIELQHEIFYFEDLPEIGQDEQTEEDARAWVAKVADILLRLAETPLLRMLTLDVQLKDVGTGWLVYLPADMFAEVQGLPTAERTARVKKLAQGLELPATRINWTCKGQTVAADLYFAIRPLVLEPDRDRAYFPIHVWLDFIEGDPAAWSRKERNQFFADLLKNIDAQIISYKGDAPLSKTSPSWRARVVREDFAVPHAFVPMHRLAERNKSNLPLFPEERRRFFELRTPLNWAVGLALFSFTSEQTPEGWQEVEVKKLVDRVYCLTERDAPRRGDYRADILAEVLKLNSVKNAYVRFDWQRHGRFWKRLVVLGMDYAIPNIELVFLDKRTGRLANLADPALRALTGPLTVKCRRAFVPSGEDIKALPNDRFELVRIRWRWNPKFADDLRAAPALDERGNVKRDFTGRVLRGGFNIPVAIRIFDALRILRRERARTASNLLVLLAHDIYKPPKVAPAANRHVIEREASRLFDLLGLEVDPKAPDQAEDAVEAAVRRLKRHDIAALLPGSDERPRQPSEAELASGRRKGPYYRLVRSPEYTPAAALVTREEAAALEAGAVDAAPVKNPAEPETGQLFPNEADQGWDIPSGPELRAARDAAGMNLRDFARLMGRRPGHNFWARFERGERVRVWAVPEEVWAKVRDFVGHAKKRG